MTRRFTYEVQFLPSPTGLAAYVVALSDLAVAWQVGPFRRPGEAGRFAAYCEAQAVHPADPDEPTADRWTFLG